MRTIVLGSVPLLLLAACGNGQAEKETTKPAEVQAAPRLPVDVKIAERSPLDHAETIAGTVMPNREVTIMSELTKKVSAVSFSDGTHVSAGQVLYKLDDSDIQARIRQLKAELSLASINERRLHALLQTETVRQEEYDVANTRLQSMEASLQALQVELSKTVIRAPFSGRIGITKVYPGTLVSPGMPLVTLQDQGTVKISFAVSEKYMAAAKPGNTIHFTTENSQEEKTARIIASEAGININSRNIELIALAPNPNALLKPGMSVKVSFHVNASSEAGILLPTESLIPGSNGYSVFLVKNGVAKINPVKIGNRNEKEAIITSGLQDGDTVMVSNILRAMDGTPVTVVSNK